MHAQACIICAKMSAASDEIIESRVSRTAEDFEREIDEYTSSDIFAVDVAEAIATSQNEVSPSVSSIEALWSELATEDEPILSEFDEGQAGFVSAEKAIDAANQYAGLRLTWSRKPPQSQMDMSVANRILGDGQKYQRLVGCCPNAGSGCEFRVTFRLTADPNGGNAAYKRDNCVACVHNHVLIGAPLRTVDGYQMKERMEQLTPDEKSDIMKHGAVVDDCIGAQLHLVAVASIQLNLNCLTVLNRMEGGGANELEISLVR